MPADQHEHFGGARIIELVEAKGAETDAWKAIRKEIEVLWLPEHPDYTYVVVK